MTNEPKESIADPDPTTPGRPSDSSSRQQKRKNQLSQSAPASNERPPENGEEAVPVKPASAK